MDAYTINPEHCFVIPNGVRLQIYLQQDLEYLELYRDDIETRGGIIVMDLIHADFVVLQPPSLPLDDQQLAACKAVKDFEESQRHGKISVTYEWIIASKERRRLVPWHKYTVAAPNFDTHDNNFDWDAWQRNTIKRRIQLARSDYMVIAMDTWRMLPHLYFPDFDKYAKAAFDEILYKRDMTDILKNLPLRCAYEMEGIVEEQVSHKSPPPEAQTIPSHTESQPSRQTENKAEKQTAIRRGRPPKWTEAEKQEIIRIITSLEAGGRQIRQARIVDKLLECQQINRTRGAAETYLSIHMPEIRKTIAANNARVPQPSQSQSRSPETSYQSTTPKSPSTSKHKYRRSGFQWTLEEKSIALACMDNAIDRGQENLRKYLIEVLSKKLHRSPHGIRRFLEGQMRYRTSVRLQQRHHATSPSPSPSVSSTSSSQRSMGSRQNLSRSSRSSSRSSREGTPENNDVDFRRSPSVIDLLTSEDEPGSDTSDISISETPFNFSPSVEVGDSWSRARSACPSPGPVVFGPTKSAAPSVLEYENVNQEDEQIHIDPEARLDWSEPSEFEDFRPENTMVKPWDRSYSVSSYPILDDRSSPLAGAQQDDDLLMEEFRSQADEEMYIDHEVEQEDTSSIDGFDSAEGYNRRRYTSYLN